MALTEEMLRKWEEDLPMLEAEQQQSLWGSRVSVWGDILVQAGMFGIVAGMVYGMVLLLRWSF